MIDVSVSLETGLLESTFVMLMLDTQLTHIPAVDEGHGDDDEVKNEEHDYSWESIQLQMKRHDVGGTGFGLKIGHFSCCHT